MLHFLRYAPFDTPAAWRDLLREAELLKNPVSSGCEPAQGHRQPTQGHRSATSTWRSLLRKRLLCSTH